MSGLDAIREVLIDFGLDGGELHDWRCQHPDVYGECKCLDELAEALGEATRVYQCACCGDIGRTICGGGDA